MANCSHGTGTTSFEDLSKSEEDRKIKHSLSHIRHKWVVMSGKGGVGKSSLAVNLAVGLSLKGFEVGLMDVDLHGPSIPRLLGLSALAPIRPEEAAIYPLRFSEHLKVISIEALMPDKDSAVIWRGPLKIGVIRQFICDVAWGPLDFLIIDSPPGTGDEPLTIAQTIPDAQAIIVTTPQDISLADVRKSINFCRQVNMGILGIIENMSGFTCPHCGKETALFKKDGGRRMAISTGHPFLGSVPLDAGFMEKGDRGEAYLLHDPAPAVGNALNTILENLLARVSGPAKEVSEPMTTQELKLKDLKVAIPLADGVLCNHFGHCEQFVLIDLKGKDIVQKELVTPPPHEPGLLPRWLGEKGVNLIIAGGMGQRALSLFAERGIKVMTGAPQLPPEELIGHLVSQTLVTGANVCDH